MKIKENEKIGIEINGAEIKIKKRQKGVAKCFSFHQTFLS